MISRYVLQKWAKNLESLFHTLITIALLIKSLVQWSSLYRLREYFVNVPCNAVTAMCALL